MTTVNCRPNSEVGISPVDHAGKSMLYLLYGTVYVIQITSHWGFSVANCVKYYAYFFNLS